MSDKPRSSALMSETRAAAGMPVALAGYRGYTYDAPAFRSSVFPTRVACGMSSNDLDHVTFASIDRPWDILFSRVACPELKLELPAMYASTIWAYLVLQPAAAAQ